MKLHFDTLISTKLGEINCFILFDTLRLNKEYWSEEKGMIMMEAYDENNEWEKAFKLSRIEYANK